MSFPGHSIKKKLAKNPGTGHRPGHSSCNFLCSFLGSFPRNFKKAVKSGFDNYANFEGRASRSEFWYWMLFYVIARIGAAALDQGLASPGAYELGGTYELSGPFELVAGLALVIPLLSVTARRMHDTDHSAWWVLTIVAPVYLAFVKGDDAINRFGAPSI